MKFHLPTTTPPEDPAPEVCVGDVFNVKGRGPAKYWVIIAIRGRMAMCVGIDGEGQIVSASNYGVHVFEGQGLGAKRTKLGRVEGLEELGFDVNWEQEP